MLKLAAYGDYYFDDFWNRVDFFVVLVSFVNLIPGIPNLTVLRTVRMLKPLRAIQRLQNLRIIVDTVVRSSQAIADV